MDDNTSTSAGSLEGTVGGVELGGGEGGRVYESGLMRKIKGGGGQTAGTEGWVQERETQERKSIFAETSSLAQLPTVKHSQ